MAGRDREFDDFAHAAWPKLHRSAYLLTGDHHLAEDLAQTALERTYAKWRTVRSGDALAYCRRVLVNLNVDRIRRRRFFEVGAGPWPTPTPERPTPGPTTATRSSGCWRS